MTQPIYRLSWLINRIVFLIALASAGAFASEPDAGKQIKTELYFGLSKTGGGVVSADEWTDFLDTAIAPHFDGLTALDADGRYLDKSGKIRSERSKLVILIHAATPEKSKAIDAIVALYKTRFNQESVLRVQSAVRTVFAATAPPAATLGEYFKYADSERLNDPADYIAYLKKARFKAGELDHLPAAAIILHSADPEAVIKAAGDVVANVFETGSATPNRLIVAKRNNGAAYLVNRGLPGAGGIAAQVAELGALGVKQAVHLGTCAQLGGAFDEKTVIVSAGSYKDGAAVMLAQKDGGVIAAISRPDADFAGTLSKMLKARDVPIAECLGYTIPIYYGQPSGLIRELLTGDSVANARPAFIDMEEAAFFEAAKRAGVKSASLTVPADKYFVKDEKVAHEFLGDPSPALLEAFKAARDAIEK